MVLALRRRRLAAAVRAGLLARLTRDDSVPPRGRSSGPLSLRHRASAHAAGPIQPIQYETSGNATIDDRQRRRGCASAITTRLPLPRSRYRNTSAVNERGDDGDEPDDDDDVHRIQSSTATMSPRTANLVTSAAARRRDRAVRVVAGNWQRGRMNAKEPTGRAVDAATAQAPVPLPDARRLDGVALAVASLRPGRSARRVAAPDRQPHASTAARASPSSRRSRSTTAAPCSSIAAGRRPGAGDARAASTSRAVGARHGRRPRQSAAGSAISSSARRPPSGNVWQNLDPSAHRDGDRRALPAHRDRADPAGAGGRTDASLVAIGTGCDDAPHLHVAVVFVRRARGGALDRVHGQAPEGTRAGPNAEAATCARCMLILAVCAAPVVAVVRVLLPAAIAHEHVNYGELLPTQAAPLLAGTRADGKRLGRSRTSAATGSSSSLRRPRATKPGARLYATRQARTMQGRERERVTARVARDWRRMARHGAARRAPGRRRRSRRGSPGRAAAARRRARSTSSTRSATRCWRGPRRPTSSGVARDLTELLKASRIG